MVVESFSQYAVIDEGDAMADQLEIDAEEIDRVGRAIRSASVDIRPDAALSTVDHYAFGSPAVADALEQSTAYRAARANASADVVEGLGHTAIHIAAEMAALDVALSKGLEP